MAVVNDIASAQQNAMRPFAGWLAYFQSVNYPVLVPDFTTAYVPQTLNSQIRDNFNRSDPAKVKEVDFYVVSKFLCQHHFKDFCIASLDAWLIDVLPNVSHFKQSSRDTFHSESRWFKLQINLLPPDRRRYGRHFCGSD